MKKSFLLLTLFITCFGVSSAKKITLSFNPSPGKTYQYTQEMTQFITQTIFDKTIETKQNINIIYDMVVLEKNKKNTRVDYKYKDMLFEMINDQFSMRYKYGEETSDNPVNKILESTFSKLMGQSIIVTFEKDGSITEVSGLKEIVESLKETMVDEPNSNQMIEQITNSMLNEEAMKKMFEQSTKIYPNKAIKSGESWEVEQKNDVFGLMSLTTQTNYTLQSIHKKTAEVVFDSVVTGDMMNGSQTGTIEYELKSGLPINSTISQQLTGEFKMGEISMPYSLLSETKVTIR